MANTIIPAKDIGKVFLEDFHKAMTKNFPKLEKGTREYDSTLAKCVQHTLGGLFFS